MDEIEERSDIINNSIDRTDIDIEVANTVFDITLKEYEQLFDDKRDLDQKTGILFAGIGIIIGFIITKSTDLNPSLMYIGIGFMILSSVACIYELLIRTYHGINSDMFFDTTIARGNLKNPIQTKLDIIAAINDHTIFNTKIYEDLLKSTIFAILSFMGGIMFFFFSYFFR